MPLTDASIHSGTAALLEAGSIEGKDCVLHPSGVLMVSSSVTAQFKQGTSAWHMARHGCLTASRLPIWLGFFHSKCTLMDKSLRDDVRLVQALADVQHSFAESEGTVPLELQRQFACAWGSNLEPNGLLTLLDAFPDLSHECSLYEHGFQQLNSWPSELEPGVPIGELPPIGVSLDGVWHADPLGPSGCSSNESVVEIKCQFPFKAVNGNLWSLDNHKKPGAIIRADHFAQVQLQMLVSGCSQAYLVHFSVTKPSIILRVAYDSLWMKKAIRLVHHVWIESKNADSNIAITMSMKAKSFWQLTRWLACWLSWVGWSGGGCWPCG